ncbi:MAG: tripartite tricarboxylate transporter TctB family protein [Rhodospirillaceae bacterium]|jgi:hypothetical protein|nr:tripartite tricarboxylate transporter TctB family protein [Rhodospirillaceae bacterium]MBT4588711.1 tripartite tricarboxylate transporter TctB family protein [Rhodospirillaceae bacterium]MBT4938536.1 tripartite tricarboxylate transporter TctB family protein [Rhodospirillaceae bacterium]MBT5940451.1 tripartite tricarboxylate transporter TctB family protein [Rhodospirillaceae bacterium]MBT7265615.1 tripartite tricarboxylate transporter TctB family protein [Rhodospirillaceae bacterium]
MAENAEAQGSEKVSIGSELIIPVAAFFFTIYYFITIWNAPWTAQVAAFIVGSILLFLVVLIVIKSVRSLSSGEGELNFNNLVNPKSFIPKRLGLLALTIGYIFIVPSLGFTITTFLFLSMAMLVLSDFRKKRLIFALAATLSLGGYLLFIVAFKTRFPAGPFETFMKGFF